MNPPSLLHLFVCVFLFVCLFVSLFPITFPSPGPAGTAEGSGPWEPGAETAGRLFVCLFFGGIVSSERLSLFVCLFAFLFVCCLVCLFFVCLLGSLTDVAVAEVAACPPLCLFCFVCLFCLFVDLASVAGA